MDVREKLIELLTDLYGCDPAYYDVDARAIAQHLVERAVAFQKWISVDDKLPEDDSDVVAYLQIDQEGRIYPANYAKGVWFDCIFNTPATGTTTHWMPLPEPPKGE